jgi:general secretion pathway protein L
MQAEATLRTGITQLAAGWRWWLAELASMVPEPVREFFAVPESIVTIEALDAEFIVARRAGARVDTIARIPRDALAARALRLSIPQVTGWRRWLDDPVILNLAPGEALQRTLTLPLAAERNLDGILKHEVARQSPIDADNIYFDYRATQRNSASGTLAVDLRIMRRDGVDALVGLCRDAGITLSAIEFMGDAVHADGGNLPCDPAANRELKLRPKIVPVLGLSVLLLALGLVWAVFLRGEMVQGRLSDKIDDARMRAATVEHLERDLKAADRQIAFLSREKRNPAAVAVLAAVTRLLPDESWLNEFELNGNEVRIHGFSDSAASLIAKFDSSPDFGDAQFRAPLMQGALPGTQRFDISLKLKGSAP